MPDTIAIVPRDLLDLGATAGEIAIAVKSAGIALGDAWEFESDPLVAARTAVERLRRARGRLDALIAELQRQCA